MAASNLDEETVRQALRRVIDPELGDNIVDLGLVYAVRVGDGGSVDIVMTTTTRGCPAAAFLKQGARDAATDVPGVGTVEVRLTYDPPWTPGMMSDAAREHLGIAGGP